MQLHHPRQRLLAVALTSASLAVVAGCGSSSGSKSSLPPSSSAPPPGSSSTAASSSAAGGSSSGSSLTVSGDFSAAGKQEPTCGQLQDQGGGHFEIPLTYTPTTSGGGIASGASYSLEFLQIPAGKTQLNGTVSDPQTTIKFSYQLANGDSLDWGINALPPNPNGQAAPGSASGSLDIASDGKTGTADLTLGFAGDDQGKVSASDHKPIQITATWKCP